MYSWPLGPTLPFLHCHVPSSKNLPLNSWLTLPRRISSAAFLGRLTTWKIAVRIVARATSPIRCEKVRWRVARSRRLQSWSVSGVCFARYHRATGKISNFLYGLAIVVIMRGGFIVATSSVRIGRLFRVRPGISNAAMSHEVNARSSS